MSTGQGKDHLAGNTVPTRKLMDIHADVYIRDQETPAELFKLTPSHKVVYATNDYVASPQQVASLLPVSNSLNTRIGIDSKDQLLDHLALGALRFSISRATTHHAVKVRSIDMIEICSDKPADAYMSQLLAYM
jgi:hypothetical protein